MAYPSFKFIISYKIGAISVPIFLLPLVACFDYLG